MNARAQKWIDRVRSGVWTKAGGNITTGPGRYCILGTMVKFYEEETGCPMFNEHAEYLYDNEEALPEKVRRWFGFKQRCPEIEGRRLVSINDRSDSTLQMMADMVAAHEKELLKPEPPPKVEKKPSNFGGHVPAWMSLPIKRTRQPISK